MNRILIFFIYALGLSLCVPALFPSLRLTFFAPFLVFIFYQKDKTTGMWWAFLCGLIIDLLSTHMRLGTYAFTYCLVTWILYPHKQHFFEDNLTTLPLMTALFSILSILIQICLLYTMNQKILFSWNWMKEELFWTPVQDGLYAGIAFSFPSLFFPKITKRPTSLFAPKIKL